MTSQTPVPLLLLAVLILLPGCSAPKAVRTYEFINAYERMTDEYDPMVSLVYLPKAANWRHYRGIAVGFIGVGHELVTCPEEAFSYATFFRLVLREELVKLGRFDFVSLDGDLSDLPPDRRGDVLLVEGMVTKIDFGSGLKRYLSYFLWFLESGATDFQIEGRITNAGSGAILAEFVDRRRSLCNTPFGPNPKTFDSGFAMRSTARDTAACLARFIEMGREGLPAVDAGRAGQSS